MPGKDTNDRMEHAEESRSERSETTHSGTPNATDPNEERSTEHKSGYGGEGGKPRTSADKREKPHR